MRNPDAADGLPVANNPQTLIEQDAFPREIKPRQLVHVTPPAALSATPNLAKLLVALRRRWLLAVSLGLLVAPAVAGAVWILRPITFTARTTLHVNSTQ